MNRRVFPDRETEALYARVLRALHDAVIYRPMGSRFTTLGRTIQPLGSNLASELIGHSPDYTNGLLNENNPRKEPLLRHLVIWLAHGMDPSPLDELESIAGRVAWPLPDAGEHANLHAEAIRVGKEVGDVFARLQAATDPESAGGKYITRREAEQVVREVREACAELMALAEAVKKEAI